MVLLQIIVFLLVLGTIILIHELGHFFFARKADILCHEFAIGMGPVIYQKRKGEIAYSIRAIPFGGYVAMAGEDFGDMIKVGQRIGVRLNDDNKITDIVLDNDVSYDFIGKVESFDLYGANNAPLFIEIEKDNEIIKYEVLRDAKYRFKKDKPMWVTPAERSYETKTLLQRFLVIIAGPAMNFILAFFILFILAFFIGKPSNKPVVGKIGDMTHEEIHVGDTIEKINGVNVNKWSDISGLVHENRNDTILITVNGNEIKVNVGVVIQGLGFTNIPGNSDLIVGQVFGREKDLVENDKISGIYMSKTKDTEPNYTMVSTWEELLDYININKDASNVYLQVLRDGNTIDITYEAIKNSVLEKLGNNFTDYSIGIERDRNFNILYPLTYPFQKMGGDVKEMLVTIGLLISPTSGVGIKDLAGPVGMYSIISSALGQGLVSLFTMMAFLSINVGFLNLLPIPALDGGRLVFLGYEAITKKKVSKKIEGAAINITFILLLILIVFVTFNDIIRMFG